MSNITPEKYNKAYISGKVASEAAFSHETYGEKFYELTIKVPRLSGADDTLPITVSERILPQNLTIGSPLHVLGQFRSYNKLVDGKYHLMLTIFVREWLDAPKSNSSNKIVLAGYVCKKPAFRVTPLRREIADLLLAVNRNYNKSDYIPAIAWGRNAKFVDSLNVGDRVIITGRIQSREYQKKQPDDTYKTLIAYEVSASKIALSEDDSELELWR